MTNFAVMYRHEKPTDTASVKSRNGFIITFADFTVVWVSKLQTETNILTMGTEIITMDHCFRELFPIINIATSLGMAVGLYMGYTTTNVSFHEEN